MRRLVVAVASVAFAAPCAPAAPPGDGSFAAARLAPPDATALVRVRDAIGLRATGSVLPAQAALLRLADQRVLGQAWDGLAGALGLPADQLVDRLLGTDATYLERSGADGAEWTLVARSDQALQDLFLARLSPAVGAGGRSAYPAFRLVSAWRPPYMLIGPADRPALFEQALARFDAAEPPASLAGSPDLAAALAWDAAPVELALRHPAGVGGMTVVSARPSGGELRLRHRSRFDRPPIHVAPGAPADTGLVQALQDDCLAVLAMNPWRGPLEEGEPLDALLAEGGADESLRATMAARQLVVVGSRTLDGSRIQVPAAVLAVEVRDHVLARQQWDAWARRFAEAMSRRAGMPPAVPPQAVGQPRRAGINAALRAAFSDHPFAREADLAWDGVTGANGSWQLVGSDPGLLARVRDRIASAARTPDPGGADEVGVLHGRMLGSMLRSWVPDAALFAPTAPEPFAQAVGLLAEVAAAAPTVRWRAWSRPGGAVESDVVIVLPGPDAVAAPPAATGSDR